MPLCPRCRRPTDETDCYCRYCGRALRPRTGFWFDHGGLLLLTLVIGPFSLAAVWLSHKISRRAQWLWTAGILLFSAYLFYASYRSFLLLKEALPLLLSPAF